MATFPGDRGWGYDGVGLYAVHEVYVVWRLRPFIDAAHARGWAVLDVVHNHLGPEVTTWASSGRTTDRHHTPWGDAVNLDGDSSHEVRAPAG